MNTNLDQNGGFRHKVFIKKHCAPGKNRADGSCLDIDLLKKIAKIVNKMEKKDDKFIKIDYKASSEKIHENICVRLHKMTGCSSEACWLKIKNLMKHLGKDKNKFKDSFKPIMPDEWISDFNAWLGTDDIENCLGQHHVSDKSFYFYGAEPIDFADCYVSKLCSFNMKKHLEKGQTKIGIVFNTDPHTDPGQHWISLFADLKGHNLNGIPGIYYFDSYGYKPCDEIQELIDKIKQQAADCKKPIKYFYNDRKYQTMDAQCGIYSIHFIKEMLKGVSFPEFLRSGLNDKKMIEVRDNYFISPNEIKI